MYGLGGGFGGMPYISPGSALISGFEAGTRYLQSAQIEQDRKDQLAYQRAREDRMERMQQAHLDLMDRNETDRNQREALRDAMKFHQEDGDAIDELMDGLKRRHNYDMKAIQADPEYINKAKPMIDAHNKAEAAIRDSIMGPILKQGNDRAKEWADGMGRQHPDFDPTDPENGADLHHMISAACKCDPSIFLQGPNGEPSKFQQAQRQIHQGFQNDDSDSLYQGMDTIFGNQFAAGRLGYRDPMGGVITGASLNKQRPLLTTPDGNAVHPVLTLSGETAEGDITTQPYAPPVKAGYDHPDNTELSSFTFQKMFDQLGTMGAMQALVSHPAIQQSLTRAVQKPDQKALDWAHAYTGAGNNPSNGAAVQTIERDDGSKVGVAVPITQNGYGAPVELWRRYGTKKQQQTPEEQWEQGLQSSGFTPEQQQEARARRYGIEPKAGAKGSWETELEAAAKEGNWTPEETDEARRRHFQLEGKPTMPPEKEAEAQAAFARRQVQNDFGVSEDPLTHQRIWMEDSPKGTPSEQAHKAGDEVSGKDLRTLSQRELEAERAAHGQAFATPRTAPGGPGGVQQVPGSGMAMTREQKGAAINWFNQAARLNPKASHEQLWAAAQALHLIPEGAPMTWDNTGAVEGPAPAGAAPGAQPPAPAPAPAPKPKAKEEEPILKTAPLLPKGIRERLTRPVAPTPEFRGIEGG
jgi:hypothetical protein